MSADCEWESWADDSGFYYGELDGRELQIIFMEIGKEQNLSILIHEINECELHKLLTKLGYDSIIQITKKMKKWEEISLKEGNKIFVSHLIAPYGKNNCLMPRKKYRPRW